MSFTEAEEDQLINLVMKYSFLYDTSHERYKDLADKDATWKEIGQQLNKISLDCKRQWKVMRDSYARYKKCTKYVKRRNTKLKRYEQLKFLDGIPQNRAGSSNVRSPSPEFMTEGSSEDPLSPNEQKVNMEDNQYQCIMENHEIKIEPVETNEGNKMFVITGDNEGNEVQNETKVSTRVKKLKRRSNKESLIYLRRDAKCRTLMTKKKDDDIDFFCRHIGEVLRSLPPLDKAKAKKHLSDVISEYEISAASRSQ